MRKLTPILSIALCFSILSGCAESKEVDKPSLQPSDKIIADSKPASGHFESHFQDAGVFLDLKHKGDEYRKQGMYTKAIEIYEQALNDHAYSRPEQAIASSRIATTYEKLGNDKMAAKYYDIAAKTTMNEDQAHEYSQKANDLRH